MTMSTRARSCVLTDSLQYNLSPGLATNLMANSFWNMTRAHLKNGLWRSSLKTNGEDIWYGKFARHTSKNGKSCFKTSPTTIVKFFLNGVPWTRFSNSATSLVSTSQATTCLTPLSRILTVMFPVPGPTSRTTSEWCRLALSIMEVMTKGFLRMCCPRSLLKVMPCLTPLVSVLRGFLAWSFAKTCLFLFLFLGIFEIVVGELDAKFDEKHVVLQHQMTSELSDTPCHTFFMLLWFNHSFSPPIIV